MINHQAVACDPFATPAAAPAMSAKPPPSRISPSPNFTGREGSFSRAANRTHKAANNGAKMITKTGPSDWNHSGATTYEPSDPIHLAGKKIDPRVRSVKRSAKRLNDEPACSKPAQKSAELRNRITIT